MSGIIPSNQHSISLQQAITMTQRYRKNRDNIFSDEFKGRNVLPIAETFNKDAFNKLFLDRRVKALRIYYGMSEDLQIHAIVVGVDENNKDLLPSETTAGISVEITGDFDILEEAVRCPPICDESSPLNEP